MAKRIFTKEEIAALKRSRHVLRVSERSITYHPDFKLAAVKRYQEGLPPSVIFREAGFDLAQIGKETPKYTLIRWRKKFDRTGVAGLAKDGRGTHGGGGRPPNLERMSEKDKLKYLEAQVAYLKAENAFLARLRKQRLNYGHGKSSRSSGR
jgi:transposase